MFAGYIGKYCSVIVFVKGIIFGDSRYTFLSTILVSQAVIFAGQGFIDGGDNCSCVQCALLSGYVTTNSRQCFSRIGALFIVIYLSVGTIAFFNDNNLYRFKCDFR